MSELLQAAKAVIDRWDAHHVIVDGALIAELRAEVEQAEKQDAVGFEEWWDKNADLKYKFVPIGQAKQLWNAATTVAKQAERERIRARAKIAAEKVWKSGDWYIGPQHNMIEQFVNALLEDSDATT